MYSAATELSVYSVVKVLLCWIVFNSVTMLVFLQCGVFLFQCAGPLPQPLGGVLMRLDGGFIRSNLSGPVLCPAVAVHWPCMHIKHPGASMNMHNTSTTRHRVQAAVKPRFSTQDTLSNTQGSSHKAVQAQETARQSHGPRPTSSQPKSVIVDSRHPGNTRRHPDINSSFSHHHAQSHALF